MATRKIDDWSQTKHKREPKQQTHTHTHIKYTPESKQEKNRWIFFYRALDRVPNGLEEHEDKSMVIRRVEFRETDICRKEIDWWCMQFDDDRHTQQTKIMQTDKTKCREREKKKDRYQSTPTKSTCAFSLSSIVFFFPSWQCYFSSFIFSMDLLFIQFALHPLATLCISLYRRLRDKEWEEVEEKER